MQKTALKNGLKVLYQKKAGASLAIQALINTGSMYEAPQERGIAHFLEHMLFEGTTKRPTTLAITNEIERIGGEFNAYTTHERTCFYIKVLQKHFSKAVEILADILQHPLFLPEQIEKEKYIVLKEIALVNDDPKFEQWRLLQEELFRNHPCRFPTYGDKKVIRALSRDKLLSYFAKYYQPGNITISIVGDQLSWKEQLEKHFTAPSGKKVHQPRFSYALPKSERMKKVKRAVQNSYLVLGFPTVPRQQKDSYALDVINGILGRGQSGRIFTELRSKQGLAYDVGTQHGAEINFGYFALYATIDKKNTQRVKELMQQEIEKLSLVTEQDLREAKDFIEGDTLLELEDVQKAADQLLFWEQVGDARLAEGYLAAIKKVTRADVRRVVKKYLQKGTLVVMEGK